MEIRWLSLFVASVACSAALALNQTEMTERPKSGADGLYEMLLRFVADNAFKTPADQHPDALPKSDDHYEELYYEPTQVQETASQNQAANNFYYGQPARRPSYGHKGKDKDVLWELVETLFGKKKFKFEEALFEWLSDGKGQHGSYGRPSYVGGSGQQHAAHGPSKADVFTKVKLLAVASTALLIALGGLILLAPLIVGKTKGRAFDGPLQGPELAALTQRVLHAIARYEYKDNQQP